MRPRSMGNSKAEIEGFGMVPIVDITLAPSIRSPVSGYRGKSRGDHVAKSDREKCSLRLFAAVFEHRRPADAQECF